MQGASALQRELVFVGGGHAHVLALRMLAMRPLVGLRVTLVSLSSHTPYSGMLPGLVAGHYSFEDAHIDLARFCQWAGVRFIAAEVTGIDQGRQQVLFAERPPLHYDVLSVDTGSGPELDSVPGARQFATPVKPVHQLWQRWTNMRAQLDSSAPGQRVVIVGGGAGSVELALAMAAGLGRGRARLQLLCGAPQILTGYNRRARAAVNRALQRWDIDCVTHARVTEVGPGSLRLSGGEQHLFDQLFWCTAAAPAAWVAASGLPTVDGGFLALRDTLQVQGHDNIFAAGDVATQVNHPRAKAGVYAVRQGPVLADNLTRYLLGRALREHRPQSRFLSLLSLGEKTAAADRGLFSASGAWVWRWKDRIDRGFMRQFAELPSMSGVRPAGEIAAAAQRQAPCGGCGAKVDGASLSRVLQELGGRYPAAGLPDAPEDAVAISKPGEDPLWQSIDMLRGLVGDPWLMGRIAANHALSDLYAMGLQPRSAQALVCLPFAAPALLGSDLAQLLDGALHEFGAVDCRLLGGHSMQGPEQAIGFVVNGVAPSGGQVLAKRGMRPADRLVLTGPLGTGTLFAGHMQLQVDGRDLQAATSHMLMSNSAAADIARECGVSACTDITGFGLAGHLLEMLTPGLGASLVLDRLPVLPGVRDCLERGIVSSAHDGNAAAGHHIEATSRVRDSAAFRILFDPQTGGGLLLAVAAGRAAQLCELLRRAGYDEATEIGEVFAAADGDLPLRVTA